MNLLLFDATELSDSSRLKISGERGAYLIQVQGIKVGHRIKVGQLNGPIYWGEIKKVEADFVVIELDYQDRNFLPEDSRTIGVNLVLAMPRPQMFKRILQTAATMGVEKIVIIGSSKSEKSYFSSPVVTEKSMRQLLLLGLEQGVTTYLPEVVVEKDFKRFVRSDLLSYLADQKIKLVADPSARFGLAEIFSKGSGSDDGKVTVAIGPEAGWDKKEIEIFTEKGFELFSLGSRILRVETAVTYSLAQINLLREMSFLKII